MTTLKVPHLAIATTNGFQRVPLVNGSYWTVGRSRGNSLVITDPWISRNHALIQRLDSGDFYLIDLGSRNGSFVNGRRVNVPVILQHQDQLMFGQSELVFHNPVITDQTVPQKSSKRGNAFESDPITDTLHERRLVSVMVVDIRNFTYLSRSIDQHTLSRMVGAWFQQAGEIIKNSGSWVDKYIGDAVMSVWFHGEKSVNPHELIQIFQAVSDLNQMTTDLRRQLSLPFELRIGAGINTGYAMVGNAGTGDRPDYTAIGDTVNAAFRLESATKQLAEDVAIGETTYEHVNKITSLRKHFREHQLTLKGYDQPFHAFSANYDNLNFFLIDHLVKSNRTTQQHDF